MTRAINWLGSAMVFICVMGITGISRADTYIWNGRSLIDSNWSSITNWSADVALNGQTPPEQMTLFTFDSIIGEEFLDSWVIQGEGLEPYSTRVKRVGNTLVMTAHASGTLLMLR
ncbi:MAG: hypothetical protein PF904_03000 [Kiritimatiellae bacterium]|jgi:hypothetical protein|nr:hypothetical protein [Kiritimatiellia bacterium]